MYTGIGPSTLTSVIIYSGLHRGRVAPSREHNHHLHLSTDLERIMQRYEAHPESVHEEENAEASPPDSTAPAPFSPHLSNGWMDSLVSYFWDDGSSACTSLPRFALIAALTTQFLMFR